ncbi:MAG: hypothetical protein NTZ56_10975 [Acidobacteria bacterium]|nr:hypothetical protein [Acidobacteriota bacterium]
MAKFKPARSKKTEEAAPSNLRAVPCLILILTGLIGLALIFYFGLKAGAR